MSSKKKYAFLTSSYLLCEVMHERVQPNQISDQIDMMFVLIFLKLFAILAEV